MQQDISAVIIDTDSNSRKNIEGFLKGLDKLAVSGTADDYSSGYDMVARARPSVVIMEIDSDRKNAFSTAERIMKNFPGTCVIATSCENASDAILSAMRCGCTEYLLRPVDTQELTSALKKIGRLMVPRDAHPRSERGSVITCFSPKGGVGNTTVAINLAVALHQATEKPVVLVDLDLEGGDAAMFLNLRTKYTISDATSNLARLDQAFLRGVLSKHSSGIHLLAEPQRVEDAEGITPFQAREVLEILRGMFSYVVVDTKTGYGDMNIAVFDSSDLIVLTGILTLPSLRNVQKALDVFHRLGYDKDRVRLLINRFVKKGEISVKDAERALSYKVFCQVPNNFEEAMASINRGVPLTFLSPASEISRTFKELAAQTRTLISGPPAKARATSVT